jgi:hypothetical protein
MGDRKDRCEAAYSRYYEKVRNLRSAKLPAPWRAFGELLLWNELEDELAKIWAAS